MQLSIKNIKKPRTIISSSKTRNEEVNNSRGNLSPKWGVVEAVYSEDNTADVTLRNGLLLRRVTVLSKEWAGKNDNNPFGKQDLPPVGTEVLMVFPDNLMEEVVIIGTRFEILGEVGTEQKTEFLVASQERLTTIINEFGWKIIYDKDNGDWTLTHPTDTDFLIEVDEQNTTITIKDWNANKIEFLTTGIKITDKNSNIVEMKAAGIDVTDANNNTVVCSSTGVLINGNLEVLQ